MGKVYIPVQFWYYAVSPMVFIGMSNLLALFHIRPSPKGTDSIRKRRNLSTFPMNVKRVTTSLASIVSDDRCA